MPYVERTITGENEIIVTDSLESPLFDFLLSGNSEQIQDPPPSPENPQPIRGVGRYNDKTQKYEVTAHVTGKNLFDRDAWYNYFYNAKQDIFKENIDGRECLKWRGSSGYNNETQGYISFPFYVKAGTKFTLSFYAKKEHTTGQEETGFYIDKADGTYERLVCKDVGNFELHEKTYMLNADVVSLRMFYSHNTYCYFSDIQIEFGTEATTYELYKEQRVKLSLAEQLRGIGDYKDIVTKDGVARNFKELKFDGTEAWETWGANNTEEGHIGFFIYTKMLDKQNIFEKEIMCNMLKTVDSNYGGRGVGICLYIDERDRFNSYFSIALKNAMLEDVSTEEKAVQSFKKLLAQKKDEGKQFKLLARISHPIKEELPEECQKAIEKLSTYDPTTVITVDGGEIPIGIKITYKAKEAKAWKFFI